VVRLHQPRGGRVGGGPRLKPVRSGRRATYHGLGCCYGNRLRHPPWRASAWRVSRASERASCRSSTNCTLGGMSTWYAVVPPVGSPAPAPRWHGLERGRPPMSSDAHRSSRRSSRGD
jgi:hypothetical protein